MPKAIPFSYSGPATTPAGAAKRNPRPLRFSRHIALITLFFVLALAIALSTYIGLEARETLFAKQKASAEIMADYLDNQIFRRFTLPTQLGFSSIDLNHPAQYRHLDEVVQSTVYGLQVERVRIFDASGMVVYSTKEEEVGNAGLASSAVLKAANFDSPLFETDSSLPSLASIFALPLPPSTYILRTTVPLRIHHRLPSTEDAGPLLSTLEFTQDITSDFENAVRFQLAVLVTTLLSVISLVLLIFFIIRRAEKAVAVRMAEEQRLLEELHQHEKLAGMGRVVASIAHEIRNPLGIIRSSAELLLKRSNAADRVTQGILTAIYDESKRLSQTVSDFLDYARPQQPKRQVVDFDATINQTLAFLSHETNQNEMAICCTKKPDEHYLVQGDSDLLYRVVYNVIINAMHASGHGGALTISLKNIATPFKGVRAVFHDSGSGFPENLLPHVLDPFFTTKDAGTGLGLPIVNSIVTSHGGTLELGNSPEGGAVITITLPSE